MSLSEPPEEHLRLVELETAVLADVEAYGRCPLADKPRVAKLSAGIQERLGRIRALTRDLELAAEEAEGEEEEQRALAALLAQHKAEYARIQAAFKQAAVDQRTAALKSAAEERRELLAGGEAGLRQRRAQTEADAAALAEDVTGGLRRTRQVLAEELEHTSATLAAMEASHTQLGKTRDEYHGQHRHLKKSKGLLGTLDWQAKSETYMLWFGLTLFLAVCAYIFQKRAGHFVPNALKPTTLLAGRQPLSTPATLRRHPAAPLHKPGGAHRQPLGKAHQPPLHMPRHQHRRPPAAPVPATQQQGEPQVGGGDGAVWPSGSPEPGTDLHEQQPQAQPQPQPPQHPAEGTTLPPPAQVEQPQQPPPQPAQQPVQPQQQPAQQPVQPQQQPAQHAQPEQQHPELLEALPTEPQGQPGEQAGGEAQQLAGQGAMQQPPMVVEQLAGEQQAAEQQGAVLQQPGSAAGGAEVQPSPVGAGQQDGAEPDLAAAAAALAAEAAAVEQAVAEAAATAAAAGAHETAAGETAAAAQAADAAAGAAAQVAGQAAGGEPQAVGPEGAPEPDRHVILDRQGRRIAVDPTAEFVRSPLGGPPAGEPAGEEPPRDEL